LKPISAALGVAIAVGLSLAACSSGAGSHPRDGHPAAISRPVATFSPYSESFAGSSPSASPTSAASPRACKRQLTAWLGNVGTNLLHAIHGDLSAYNRDDGAVVHDLLHGGNVAEAIATWQADLVVFRRDALALQDNPAPSCAGGTDLTRAAGAWAKAANAYLTAAGIIGNSPSLGGVDQADPQMNTGNNSLSRAKVALKHAVSDSGGLIRNIVKGTGT
jgi:hypothetical protein